MGRSRRVGERWLWTLVIVLAQAAGCTDASTSVSDDDDGGDSPSARSRIIEAYGAPQYIHESIETSISLCAQSVFAASIASGGTRLVTTGTLSQSSAGSTSFKYGASPADRLVLLFTDGTRLEFVIRAFQGDLSDDAAQFLAEDHVFAFDVTRSGEIDIRITSRSVGRDVERTIEGTFEFEKQTFTADVTEAETTFFDQAGSSAEFRTESAIDGTLSTTGLDITLDEGRLYHSFTSDRVAENVRRLINTTWTVDGVRYAFEDGLLKKALTDDAPVDLDRDWGAFGTITRNGTAIGSLTGSVQGNRLGVKAVVEGVTTDLGVF